DPRRALAGPEAEELGEVALRDGRDRVARVRPARAPRGPVALSEAVVALRVLVRHRDVLPRAPAAPDPDSVAAPLPLPASSPFSSTISYVYPCSVRKSWRFWAKSWSREPSVTIE